MSDLWQAFEKNCEQKNFSVSIKILRVSKTGCQTKHLFYISNAPKIALQNSQFGLGCGQWTDLKNQSLDFQKMNFLKLNTTDLRHLYVTAGQYIFVMKKEKNIFISHLDITDSQQEDKLCHKIFSIK